MDQVRPKKNDKRLESTNIAHNQTKMGPELNQKWTKIGSELQPDMEINTQK